MKTVFPKHTIIRGNILQIKNSHLPYSFYLRAYVFQRACVWRHQPVIFFASFHHKVSEHFSCYLDWR